jgi:hypothetical protein
MMEAIYYTKIFATISKAPRFVTMLIFECEFLFFGTGVNKVMQVSASYGIIYSM